MTPLVVKLFNLGCCKSHANKDIPCISETLYQNISIITFFQHLFQMDLARYEIIPGKQEVSIFIWPATIVLFQLWQKLYLQRNIQNYMWSLIKTIQLRHHRLVHWKTDYERTLKTNWTWVMALRFQMQFYMQNMLRNDNLCWMSPKDKIA